MSQSEQRGSSRPSSGEEEEVEEQEQEEKGMEEDTPLMAMAPDASLPEERPSTSTDISVSPAFQGLDELFSLGKISKTKVAKLKASYRLLHDTLKSTQESEIQLLGEAKRCRGKLEGLQAEVERAEEQATSEEPDTEVGKLRQQLLQAYNDLKAAEDREYKTQYKLECLQEEKRCLDKEYEMQPKPVGLESRMKALKDRYDDLRKEVTQSQLEVRSLMEDMETREMQILTEQKELEDKNEIIEIKQAEMAQLITAPNQLLNKIERMSRKRADAMTKVEALNKEISKMKEQLKEMDERNCAVEEEKKEAMKELEGRRAQVEATQREYRMLLKEQDTNKEKEAVLMGNRGMLEMKLQNVMTDSKLLYKRQSMQLMEKNRQMRALKRMEYALKSANEQLEHTQSIYNKTKIQRDAALKGEASLQQRMELQKEVDALKVRFEKQQSVAENESQMKQQEWTMQELLRESNQLREELHNLGCLTQIKAQERGQKHRELRRAQQINQHIQQELQEKCLVIMEHNKLNTILQRRLAQYTKMYDMIRGEKNKYVSLKQIASQTIAELTNQFKILDNDVEIQRTIGINKDRSLAKARMKHCHSHKMRDSLRNNISKMAWKLQQIGQQCEEHKLDLVKLTQMINVQEQALLEMTKSHKTAIQRRNYLGVQLLEREEEVCIFYEKTNVQEATIAKGNKALEMLEEEMRDLQLAVSEEQRQIDLKKKEVPLKSKLEGEVVMLQIELSEAKDRTLELEKALEELSQESRTRELKGTDPSTVELVKKIEQLELYLAEREEQVFEKELLLDQVTRLSQPIREQAENCQLDRLPLAKKVNELRSRIIDTNHRMMSIAAQLSMKQAAALSLQQEIKEKELQVDGCQRRLEQGLPPCPEMEEEWRKVLQDKRRRQRDKQERERLAEEEEMNQLPNGVYTTAEVRPNAYVPEAGSLPLPKPYGALAPFKPSEPGANIRHIRKPRFKPIEI